MAVTQDHPSSRLPLILAIVGGGLLALFLITGIQLAKNYTYLHRHTLDMLLEVAILHDDISRMEYVLAQGADVNSRDENGNPMLYLALEGNHIDAARVLLRFHPDANATNRGSHSTLLMAAAGLGVEDIVDNLVSHGAEINAQSRDGTTALINAAHGNHATIVSILLSHGANPNLTDHHGKTALMLTQKRLDDTIDPQKKAQIYRVFRLLQKAVQETRKGQ